MKQLISAWMRDGDTSLNEIEKIRKINQNEATEAAFPCDMEVILMCGVLI